MTALRKWLRRVATGLAAFLLAGLEFMGNHLPYSMHPYAYSYSWTEHGMRVAMEQRLHAEQQREYMARLDGEVREDEVRRTVSSHPADRRAAS